MRNPIFYIMDVFAEEKYTGNQLTVFLGAGHLPDATLQKIAAEMNYSETTFILSDEEQNGSYDVRIFTPKEEVPFTGHPTPETALMIAHEIEAEPLDRVVLNLKVGQITVSLGDISLGTYPGCGSSPRSSVTPSVSSNSRGSSALRTWTWTSDSPFRKSRRASRVSWRH